MKILVNAITTSRLLFTMFLPLLSAFVSDTAFIVIITILFFTDFIDGRLARKYKVQTLYGAYMDTLADKMLCIVLLLYLVGKFNIVSILAIGEVLIGLVNIHALVNGKKAKSSKLGKIKMWFISITIILNYMYHFKLISRIFIIISVISTLIMQIITLIDYIKIYKKQKSDKEHSIFRETEKKDIKYILFNTEYFLKNNEDA